LFYADESRPPADRVAHLSEYIVRLALRERWDLADARANTERIRRLMFAKHSELIEMAELCGLTFVGDNTNDIEVLLSVSDIGHSKLVAGHGSSDLAEESTVINSSDFSFAQGCQYSSNIVFGSLVGCQHFFKYR